MQEDLKYFEASEDMDEEFYAGGGQFRRHGLEHFPQLWCENGTYSVYGQARSKHNRVNIMSHETCSTFHGVICQAACIVAALTSANPACWTKCCVW